MTNVKNYRHEDISQLEKKIGVKPGFFDSLLEEDDWSFVIKLHALYEAAITHLILSKFSIEELEPYFSRLELGDSSKGKLRLIKDLDLLDSDMRKFVSALSDIRNAFVHKIENTDINLSMYFKNLDKNKSKHYCSTFSYLLPGMLKSNDKSMDSFYYVKENPKQAIWQTSIMVLAHISIKTELYENRRKVELKNIEVYKALEEHGHIKDLIEQFTEE